MEVIKILILFVLTVLICQINAKAYKGTSSCLSHFCKAGRECVEVFGKPKCHCLKSCHKHAHHVCGSDEVTYHNNCELHRTACVEKRHIHVNYVGACKVSIWRKFEKKNRLKPKHPSFQHPLAKSHRPIACYQVERDELHIVLRKWMYNMASTNKWLKRDEMFIELEENIFKMCDMDHDGFLISSEFLMCMARNDSKKMNSEVKTHRELCLDAIIDMADQNNDWKLDVKEFKHAFRLDFKPPTEKCALKHETYEDGYEIAFHCNTCVCACGNWICASGSCKKGDTENSGKLHKGKLPGNKRLRKFLKGFIASDLVQIKKVQKKYRKGHPKYAHHAKF